MFRKIKGCQVRKNFELKKISSFHIGGMARYFIKCSNIPALKKTIKICIKHSLKFKVVGNCSNLLFDDLGFCGAIIQLNFNQQKIQGETIVASADILLCELLASAKNNGLSGLEYYVGIPCNLGGAIFNNLGANSHEICEIIDSVKTLKINFKNISRENSPHNLNKNKKIFKFVKNTHKIAKNSFLYRKNNFLKNFEIILSAKLKLNYLDKNIIQNKIINYLNLKTNSQPINLPSAGSIFKRGKNFFPAQIIDELNLKGRRIGGAEISKKHAGFIVNIGNATSEDVLKLIQYIKRKAWINYMLVFEEEIEYVPY